MVFSTSNQVEIDKSSFDILDKELIRFLKIIKNYLYLIYPSQENLSNI